MNVVLLLLTWLCNFVISADAVVPTYLPPDVGSSRLDLIKTYFENGFTYKEILILLLSRHNISLSLSHLKRILNKLNLRRRQGVTYASIQETAETILNEMGDSGQCLGYRTMWRRLIKDHGLNVKRSTVMELLRELDPEGNASRKAHRLKRRRYILKGPNYIWHIDGYDKLKHYGFCIHGCIDGYSHRLMWLEVSSSNNNPRLIAKYYLDTLKQMKCTPRILRADYGTENSVVSYLQPLFRSVARDSMSGLESFIYGKSTSNQRIEAWWGILRRNGIHWWINLFKDLKDSNRFNLEDPVQQECLKFCFMDVLQTELDRIAQHWNTHCIRHKKCYRELPYGKPDIMYFTPEVFDGLNYGTPVDVLDVQACLDIYSIPKQKCLPEYVDLAHLLKPDMRAPADPLDALQLYIELSSLYAENYMYQ